MDTYQDLERYMENVLGEAPGLAPLSEKRLRTLPLYLRSGYRFRRARFAGTEFVLAFTGADPPERTPGEYAGHVDVIERALGQRVALVLPPIPAYKRNRLVQKKVPFIMPGRQMFLPSLFVDLRERLPRKTRPADELSPSAQTVVLYYLLGNETRGIPLQELAGRLGYSSMTMSNVRRELEGMEFSTAERQGRTSSIRFVLPRRDLWKAALETMRSPVKRKHWVGWKTTPDTALKAGTTALAELTLLGDDRIPTYAMARAAWSAAIVDELPEPDDATAVVEAWAYDPCALSNGPGVDPLSLYLSLRGSSDERVLAAIDEVIGTMPW